MGIGFYLEKGGPIVWVLGGIFFLALGISLERMLYFIATACNLRSIESSLNCELDGRPPDAAISERVLERCLESFKKDWLYSWRKMQLRAAPSLRMLTFFSEAFAFPQKSRSLRLERKGVALIAEMKQRTGILAAIGAISPLLGLLGTVTGMMDSFQEIAAASGQASMEALAAGIWEAMITTAAGLIVAILALLAHGAFASATNNRIRSMNALVGRMEEALAHRGKGSAQEVGPALAPSLS